MVKGFAKFLLNLTNTIDIIPFSINCLMYLCLRLICIYFSLYTFIVSSSHGGFIIVVHRNGWHCLWQQLNELISNTFLSYFTSLFAPAKTIISDSMVESETYVCVRDHATGPLCFKLGQPHVNR